MDNGNQILLNFQPLDGADACRNQLIVNSGPRRRESTTTFKHKIVIFGLLSHVLLSKNSLFYCKNPYFFLLIVLFAKQWVTKMCVGGFKIF